MIEEQILITRCSAGSPTLSCSPFLCSKLALRHRLGSSIIALIDFNVLMEKYGFHSFEAKTNGSKTLVRTTFAPTDICHTLAAAFCNQFTGVTYGRRKIRSPDIKVLT